MTRTTLAFVPVLLTLSLTTSAAQSKPTGNRPSCFDVGERTPATSLADSADEWITNFSGLVQVTSHTPSRVIRLSVKDVVVDDVDERGFWISANDSTCRLFVRPAEGDRIHVRRGEIVSVQGEIRYAVEHGASNGSPRQWPYLYSYIVRPAWYAGTNGAAEPRR